MSAVLALAKASGWLGEPPPRKLTRRVLDRLGFRVRGKTLDATTLVAHAGYGVATGILYAMIPGRRAPVLRGTVFGLGVWAASYMGWIPALGLMSRPKNDRPGRPTSMILAHLVFGATLGAVDRAARRMSRARPRLDDALTGWSAMDEAERHGASALLPVAPHAATGES